jgi:hypothetical protein
LNRHGHNDGGKLSAAETMPEVVRLGDLVLRSDAACGLFDRASTGVSCQGGARSAILPGHAGSDRGSRESHYATVAGKIQHFLQRPENGRRLSGFLVAVMLHGLAGKFCTPRVSHSFVGKFCRSMLQGILSEN